MKSLLSAVVVALALVVVAPAARAQEAPPSSLPVVTPPGDPNADPGAEAPPAEPPLDDPSPKVAFVMAQLHELDMQHALATAQTTLDSATADEASVRARRDVLLTDRDAKHGRLASAVTDAYVRGDTTSDDVASASAQVFVDHAIDRDQSLLKNSQDRLDASERALTAAVKARTDAQAARDGAQGAVEEATLAVSQAARLTNKQDVSPSVMGDPVLTADEIVGWFKLQNIGGYVGWVDLPTMAGYYIDEGKAEGIRGDVAFAQSIVETGAFTSPLTTHNNFAGIGACDSCATGFDFRTPQEGVRAQAQLLHAYADKNLRKTDLANPAVGTDPDQLSVRGCCTTWNKLTGTWASDPNYGPKLMTVYLSMLQYAYTERTKPVPPPVPVASPVASILRF